MGLKYYYNDVVFYQTGAPMGLKIGENKKVQKHNKFPRIQPQNIVDIPV